MLRCPSLAGGITASAFDSFVVELCIYHEPSAKLGDTGPGFANARRDQLESVT
jgi:hypothetical protein